MPPFFAIWLLRAGGQDQDHGEHFGGHDHDEARPRWQHVNEGRGKRNGQEHGEQLLADVDDELLAAITTSRELVAIVVMRLTGCGSPRTADHKM